MPIKYNRLRTLAFRLNPDITELPHRCHALEFPERWKQPLRELHASISRRPLGKMTVPIAGLNRAMRALVPDLLAIEFGAGQGGERPWLYSARSIEPERLLPIIHAWVNAAYARASGAAREQLLKEFKATDLRWRTDEQLDLAAWRTGDNGTAEAGRRDSFVLLPDKLASILSQPDVHLEYGTTNLRFRRSPMPVGQQGAELVSWPPIPHQAGSHTWYYSVVITLTVQTVPFQPFPVVHCDVGLRRWAGPNNRPPGGNTSVYLLTSVPWLRGMHETASFHVASVRWLPVSSGQSGGKPDFRLIWADYLVEMLNSLHPQRPFPEPQLLLDDPIQALNLEGSPTAAMVFRTGMNFEHPVGPGLMPPDRRSLAEQIGAMFEPTLEFTVAPERAAYKASVGKNPFFEQVRDKTSKDGTKVRAVEPAKREAVFAQRRAMVGKAVGGRLNIEIWHDTGAVRDALISAACSQLGLPAPSTLPMEWNTPELTISLSVREVGRLAAALELDSGIKDERDRLRAAMNKRIAEIAEAMDVAQPGTVAFIEMAGKGSYDRAPLEDPKSAIRIGFGRCRRLNQHLTPDNEEKLEHKANNAVLDALRQLGIRPDLPAVQGLSIPVQVVGVWLIKQSASNSPSKTPTQVPVFVSLSSASAVVRATAPGLNNSWLPYGETMLAIADGEAQGFTNTQQVRSYIKQTLEGDILAQGDTLLLCHAQNLRSIWPWLQNSRITRDRIAFGYDDEPRPALEWAGLRIVRVRSKAPFETPEWYAQSEQDEQGFTKGLFRMGGRVFASTYNKPRQFQKLSPSLSKADVWTTPRTGKTFDASPDAHAWNPGLFELTVACLQPQDNDLDWPWAALAHELRDLALHYDEATALPLPLHLGQLMEQYVVSLDEADEE